MTKKHNVKNKNIENKNNELKDFLIKMGLGFFLIFGFTKGLFIMTLLIIFKSEKLLS